MPEKQIQTRRIRNKGGPLAGKEISYEIPEFEIKQFLNTPNAEEFIKKAYKSATIKIAREIEEGTNGSVPVDLSSYEMIIARTLNFTKKDIIEWLKNRDWSRINIGERDIEKLKEYLPNIAARNNPFNKELSERIAEKLIAELSDKEKDPIANYLFVMLTVKRDKPDYDFSIL